MLSASYRAIWSQRDQRLPELGGFLAREELTLVRVI